MKYLKVIQTAILLSIVSGLAACSTLNGTVGSYLGMDTDLQVDFIVDADINPDELGKASPLFIRMYELKSPKMMSKADFIDIYERDKEVLGADMVAVQKLKRFKPGESRTEHFVLKKGVSYVGFYAEFLKFKDAKYKVIVPVVAGNVIQTSATVRVSGNEIMVEGDSGGNDTVYYDDMGNMKESAENAKAAADEAQGMSDKAKELF